MGGKLKLTGQFNVQDTDENVYQVTLDRKINPQPEYVLGTWFWHIDGVTIDQPLPKGFEQMITVAKPLSFTSDDVAANRKNWIREWLQAVTQ